MSGTLNRIPPSILKNDLFQALLRILDLLTEPPLSSTLRVERKFAVHTPGPYNF